MSYDEAVSYLYNSRPPFHQIGASAYKPGLENTMRLMAHTGNPHEQLRAIHVAGTNGKGSTSHLIASALQAAGLKVGLFTSPHLVSLTERIRINGQPIPEAEIAGFIEENKTFLDETAPSFFETMTALAFAYFVREKVDIAVIETGLGGRLDSTNVITPILSVITNIGMDHTEFLGNTLTKIAKEKAGIIKPNIPVVIGESHPQTINVFLSKAQECGAEIYFADQCEYLRRTRLRVAPECELQGIYQEHNLQTAFVALRALKLSAVSIPHTAIREGFAHVCSMTGLQGRWETLCKRPLTICDTGHNSHGIQYVARQLKELDNPHVWIVFGMVNDKDTDVVMRLLPSDQPSAMRIQRYHYIFTTPTTQRARSAQEMLELWESIHGTASCGQHIAIDDPKEAIRYAQTHAADEDAIFIGGSNYLVGDAISLYSH